MLKYICFIIFFCAFAVKAQTKFYNFNIYDGQEYMFTMNQSNNLYQSSLRYIGNEIKWDDLSSFEKKTYFASLALFTALIGQGITHEEGHRSVLSELGIGSISSPFIDKNLVLKVTGVSNETLINLRNQKFPSYIRLHTAGLESDYAYLKKADSYFNFNEEGYNVLYPDYLMRKLGVAFYYLSHLLPSTSNIRELDTENELNRDIVGHDLFGMVRHLHRPTMDFYRYTDWGNLTNEEQRYAKRIGFLSLLNFLNPNLILKRNFKLGENITSNFAVNYCVAPFGDFVEQNVYLNVNNSVKINPYFRQYFNKNYTFLGAGIGLQNYTFNDDKFILNSNLDLWNQPKDLNFSTKESETGFGFKADCAVRFSQWNQQDRSSYFNFGLQYKTRGFLPEAPSLANEFNIIIGLIITAK